jgi:PEP-CTERM motif
MKQHILTSLVFVALSAPVCRAGIVYNISLDTSPLIGEAAGPFSLGFQLNDGSGVGDANNTAILSNFQFGVGGSASGSPTVTGNAIGDLSSGITLTDSNFLNALAQSFNPGSLLTFQLQMSTNVDAGGTPDEFSFSILDSTGTQIPTTGFVDAFLIVDVDSSNPTPQTFSSDPTRAPAGGGGGITISAPQTTLATPEPGTFILLGIGLAFQISRRFARS